MIFMRLRILRLLLPVFTRMLMRFMTRRNAKDHTKLVAEENHTLNDIHEHPIRVKVSVRIRQRLRPQFHLRLMNYCLIFDTFTDP